MKLSKKITALFLIIIFVISLGACASGGGEEETSQEPTEVTTSDEREVKTKVAAPKGSLGMGVAKLKADRAYAYDVTYYDSLQDIEDGLAQGSVDIAVLPVDRAAAVYNSTDGGIRIIALNSVGNIQVLQRGSKSITSVSDLRGRTVYVSGEDALTRCVAEYVLSSAGIDTGILKSTETTDELITLAKEGKADVCFISEPYATELRYDTNPIVNPNSTTSAEDAAKFEEQFPTANRWKKVLNVSEAWEKAAGEKFAYGCVVARKDYIDANPEIIDEFLVFNEVSVNWLGTSTENAYIFLEQNMFTDNVKAGATFSGSNIIYIEKEEMKAAVESTLKILYEREPELIGNAMPEDICLSVGT